MNRGSKSRSKSQAGAHSKQAPASKASKALPKMSKPGKSKPSPEPQKTKGKAKSTKEQPIKGKPSSKSRNQSKSAPVIEVESKSKRGDSKGVSTRGKSSREKAPDKKRQEQSSRSRGGSTRGTKAKSTTIEPETQLRESSTSRRNKSKSNQAVSSKNTRGKSSRSRSRTQIQEELAINPPDERSRRSSKRQTIEDLEEFPDETKKSRKSLKKANEIMASRKSAESAAQKSTISRSVSNKRGKSKPSAKIVDENDLGESQNSRKNIKSKQATDINEQPASTSGRATRGKSRERSEPQTAPEQITSKPVRKPSRSKSKSAAVSGRPSEQKTLVESAATTDSTGELLQSRVHVIANYGRKQTDLFADRNYGEFVRIYKHKQHPQQRRSADDMSGDVPVKTEATGLVNADSMSIVHSHLQRVMSKGRPPVQTAVSETKSDLLLGQPVVPGQSKFYQVDSVLRIGLESPTVLVNVLNRYTKEVASRLFTPETDNYRKLRLESISEMIRLPGFAPKKYLDRQSSIGKQQLHSSSSQPRSPIETVLILDQLRIRTYVQGALFDQTLHTARVVPRLENMFVDPQCQGVYFMSSDYGVYIWDFQSGEELLLHGFCDSSQPDQKVLNITSMVRTRQSGLFREINSIKEITSDEFKKIGNLDEEKSKNAKYHFLIGLCRDGTIEVLNTDTKKVFTVYDLKLFGQTESGKAQSDPMIGFTSSVVQAVGEQYFVVKQYNGQSKPMIVSIFDIDHSEQVLSIRSSPVDHTFCEFFENTSQNQGIQLFCLFGNIEAVSIAQVTKEGLIGLKELSLNTFPGIIPDLSVPGQVLRGRSVNNKIYLFGQYITDPNLDGDTAATSTL